MIPILYYGNETSFTTNGLGRLNDIIECTVTEERNGIYEVEFTYPITGRFYKQMANMVEAYAIGNFRLSGIIGCIHDDKHDIQPFDIYSVSAPMNGIATFNAHHISYRLGGMVTKAFDAKSAVDAVSKLQNHIVGNNPFTFWTDKVATGEMYVETPKNVRNVLGGEEGSILDCFGAGEYEFDRFTVKLYQNRGIDSGVTVRYGKNLMDLSRDVDGSGRFNAIVPYWEGDVTLEDGSGSRHVVVTSYNSNYVTKTGLNATPVAAAIDFSSDFEEMPSWQDLEDRARQYLDDNQPWLPETNIKISFVQLWQTTEYEKVAILQRLSLCDQISVYYEDFGIVATEQEVVKVVYNVLLERYDSMELGKPLTSLANSISEAARNYFETALGKAKRAAVSYSVLQEAIAHSTELLRGGLGGHIIFNLNADGEPEEMLIMDTDDINTAVQVIRINKNGIGFSSKGYNGPFSTAWTIDGHFNADFITTGSLYANLITSGKLQSHNGRVYFDLDNNELHCDTLVSTSEDSWAKTVQARIGYYMLDESGTGYGGFAPLKGLFITAGEKPFERYGGLPQGTLVLIPGGENGATGPTIRAGVYGLKIISGPFYNGWESGIGGIIHTPKGTLALAGSVGTSVWTPTYIDAHDEPRGGRKSDEEGIILIKSCIKDVGQGNGTLNGRYTIDGQIILRTTECYCEGWFKAYEGRFYNIESINGHELYINASSVDTDFLYTSGSKTRVVKTPDYDNRLLYCYEMPTPMFGDIGESVIDEDGACIISIDDIFSETIRSDLEYHVFLQKEGPGDLWVSEKKSTYFIVEGTPNLKFSWELKAKQRDYEGYRLETRYSGYEEEEHPDDPRNPITPESAYDDELWNIIQETEKAIYETT